MSIISGLLPGLKQQSFSLTATGTIITAVGGQRLKVYAVRLIVDASLAIKFRSGASNDLEGSQSLAANGGFVEAVTPPHYIFATNAGESLDLVITGTGNAAGRISYWEAA